MLYLSGTDNADFLFGGQPLVIHIFCHTADTVSAHLRTTAVRIIHFHFKVRFFGRVDENHAVSANAEMSVA